VADPIALGVIGCGVVAWRDYFPILLSDRVRSQIKTVACCDVVEERARRTADKFGIPTACVEYHEIIDNPEIEVVAILSPIPFHYQQAMDALAAGKHVYLQKTMTTTLDEANQIIERAATKGLKVVASPGQMLMSSHIQAKELIDKGTFGKICFARLHGSHPGHETQDTLGVDPTWYYRPGGGPVYDVAVYPLHSVTGLLGPAKCVTAFSGIVNSERNWEGNPIDVEMDDSTLMLLDLGESVFAAIDGTYCMVSCNVPMFEFYGTRGVLQLGEWTRPDKPLEIYTEESVLGFGSGWFIPKRQKYAKSLDTQREMDSLGICRDLVHLVDCIRENKNPIPSAEHARHVIEIIEKAYISAQTGMAQEITTTL
jgi:predicted dehydrogenase